VLLSWQDTYKAPDRPGIYCWYYLPRLTQKTISNHLFEFGSAESSQKKSELLIKFLSNNLFRFFNPQNLRSTVKGRMKFIQKGVLENKTEISTEIASKILNRPDVFVRFLSYLERKEMVYFCSPIYIGSTRKQSLNARIEQHRRSILAQLDDSTEYFESITDASDKKEMMTFARDIIKRKMQPENLFVFVLEVNEQEMTNDLIIMLENFLNRITFPICGRN